MAYPYFRNLDKRVNAGPFSGGIVIDVPAHEIKDNTSPDMLNMVYRNGVLKKRKGQKVLFEGNGENILACHKGLYEGYIVYCADGKLMAYNPEKGERVDLEFRTQKKKGEFFTFNGKLYYTGGGEYLCISNDNGLKCESVEGYIPLRYINCDPASGAGDKNEAANYLTPKLKISYNTTEGMSELILPLDIKYDVNNVVIEKDGYVISRNRYTVRADGKILFDADMKFSEGHNNLVLQLIETDAAEERSMITFCNTSAVFGGSSSGLSEGTRVFLSGNKKYANTFFKSGLRNPEYFPVDGFEILGDTSDPITAFGKQGGGLVIFKENSIYVSLYNYSTGEAVFTLTNISPDIGCDAKDTVKNVNNTLMWLNSKYGVVALSSLNKNSGKNVSVISGNINGNGSPASLLGKDSYEDSTAFVYEGRYHLCVGNYCYVLDNTYVPANNTDAVWYLFSDISCRFPISDKTEVYLMGEKERVSFFSDCLYDFCKEKPIRAHYVTKAFSLGDGNLFKTVKDISLYLRADKNICAEIKCTDENGSVKSTEKYRVNKFSFDGFCFSDFTFRSNRYSVFLRRKILRRRVKFFSVELKNYEPLSDMAISSLSIGFRYERGVKVNGI